ncbi:hypothetical protein VNO77_01168 [Canavalia gladiata]|uniref:Uncharacterized protein n=1 Tax=Canavalia gladiata TaxID=3824 RepID=A0AAN9MRE6_CANGL
MSNDHKTSSVVTVKDSCPPPKTCVISQSKVDAETRVEIVYVKVEDSQLPSKNQEGDLLVVLSPLLCGSHLNHKCMLLQMYFNLAEQGWLPQMFNFTLQWYCIKQSEQRKFHFTQTILSVMLMLKTNDGP